MSREALLHTITRYRQGELSLGELRTAVAAAEASGDLGDELRRLDAALESIELGVCDADRRGAALEQLEPAARALGVA